jgi:hypothetical protein
MRGVSANAVLYFFVSASVAIGLIEVFAYHFGTDVRRGALALWSQVSALLLAWWVAADSRGRPGIYRPFEFGWLVLVALPIYLPYYLFKTRGVMGLAILLGFLALPSLGFFLQLGLWVAS